MEQDRSSIESFPCDKCGKIFPYKYALKRHGRYCSDSTPESCSNCNKVLKNNASLRSHERLCLRLERKLPCLICNKIYKHTNNLRRHLRYYHGIQNSKFLINAAENNEFDELNDESTHSTEKLSQNEITEEIYTLQFGTEYDDNDVLVFKLISSNETTSDAIDNGVEKSFEEANSQEKKNCEDIEEENVSDVVSVSITRISR